MIIWRPYSQMKLLVPPLPAENASGAYIFANQKKYFDGISSWWVITHGHCHPKVMEAIREQTRRFDQVNFANFSHDIAEALIDELSFVLPQELSVAFFSDNGSTAVESAMKMALQAQSQRGFSERKKFLTFENAYHGDTSGAMSVNADGLFTDPYKSMRFDVVRVGQGHFRSDSTETWLGSFRKKLSQEFEQIAAVIIEPLVQGAGGMIIWPPEIVRMIVDECREKNILVIFDEVMTGFGRTGTLFAFEQVERTPDFLCLSKGLTAGALPLSLTLTTHQIYEAFLSDDISKMFFHGHSFTGNPFACAAALANLRIFKEESTLEKIQAIHKIQNQCLESLSVPTLDRRSLGAIGVVELDQTSEMYGGRFSRTIMLRCLEKGVFLRPLGPTVYLMPPYCSTKDDLEHSWEVIEGVIRDWST